MKYRLAGLQLFQLAAAAAVAKVSGAQIQQHNNTTIWTVPEIGALPHDAYGLQVRDGRDLVTATYAVSGGTWPTHQNDTPATIWRVQIATFRPVLRSLDCRYSDFTVIFLNTVPGLVTRSASRIASIPA